MSVLADDQPVTDDEWFALIEPHIEVEPEQATSGDVIEIAKRHALQVIEHTDLAVDLSAVDWAATYELRAKHGYEAAGFIKLSRHSLETNGWQRLMQTVRHELIHVWQHQQLRSGGHGASFEEWMPVVNVEKRGGSVMPTWTIHCPNCGATVYTRQRAEEIAARFHVNDDTVLECRDCEAYVLEGDVQKDGDPVDVDELPTVYMPSEHQKRVFMHASGDPLARVHGFEWVPTTVDLTTLPGIGDATAERLGDDVLAIDDMVEDGGLAPAVKAVVPTRHTELEAAVLDCYETVLDARSGDDLERFERVLEREPDDWWHPIERVRGRGPVERLVRHLFAEVGAGDRLAIDFVGREGTVHATVAEEESTTGQLSLGLQFDTPVGELGQEGWLRAGWSTHLARPTVSFHSLDHHLLLGHPDRLVIDRLEVQEAGS